MKAFHSFWSMPNYCRNQGQIAFPDFELLTAILSALKWQENNGEIDLITDTRGAEFFQSVGLGNLWNKMDVSLDQMDPTIDPFLFWAAGKLYALKSMDLPCAMIDTDLIVWKNVDQFLKKDIIAAHPEELYPHVYPHHSIFKFKGDYQFPENWDFTLPAANTAFLYMQDVEFRDYYVDTAIDFFKHVRMDGLNPVTAMCFAEQRVLPMVAKEKNKELGFFMHLLFANHQDFMTHNWGYKDILRSSPAANMEFCLKCVRRILTDFPEREELVKSDRLVKYYDEYMRIKNKV